MEIAPMGQIKLYTGIPLSPDYENTLWFDTPIQQFNYFHVDSVNTKLKISFDQQYYTRVNRGVIKVKVCANNVYDCNYLAFRNLSYGTKWFYAFITSIEWVNNEVTLITFDIDIVQTYFFDYTLRECFVEREHTTTDEIGDNIEPEPFETGDYIANPVEYPAGSGIYQYDRITQLQDVCYIVGVLDESLVNRTDLNWFDHIDGRIIEKIYTGTSLHAFKTYGRINAFLEKYKKVPDNVLMIYTVPRSSVHCTDSEMDDEDGYVVQGYTYDAVVTSDWSASAISTATALDGYVPLNRKLYTAPFNFYLLKNSDQNSLILRYEFFNALTPTFKYGSTVMYPPSAFAIPSNYKNLTIDEAEIITESEYPLCSWVSDYWSMAMAQQIMPELARNLTGNLINLLAPQHMNSPLGSSFMGNARVGRNMNQGVGMQLKQFWDSDAPTFVNSTAQALNDAGWASAKARAHAEIFSGSPSTPTMGLGTGIKGIHGCRMSVAHHVAEKVDEYFNMYGYAVNRVKTPNRKARSRYTYVKTNGCIIEGNMPADDVARLQTIYDSGIRFWVDKNYFGVYPKIGMPTTYNNILSGV